MKTKIDNEIFAIIFSLMSELSNLRNGIDDDEEMVVNDIIRNNFIEKINSISGLNYSQIIQKRNLEEALNYETALGNYLSDLLSDYKESSDPDYLRLLNDSVFIDNKFFENQEIHAQQSNPNLDVIFHGINEKSIYKSLGSNIFKPDYISVLPSDDPLFFTTQKTTNRKGIPVILFNIVDINRSVKTRTVSSGMPVPVWRPVFSVVLNYTRNILRFNSPVRMFVYLLDKYGLETMIEDNSKKLYFSDTLNPDKEYEMKVLKEEPYSKKFNYFQFVEQPGKRNGLIFTFHLTNYIEDYLTMKI